MTKKILLVYYSRTGTTRMVAEALARELKCDVEEIQPERNYRGIWGFLVGGYEAATQKIPKIRPTVKNPRDYDLVVIGTPVWASTMASPVRSWLAQHPKSFNNVAFFCTMSSRDCGHAMPDMGIYCDADAIATVAIRAGLVKANQYSELLNKFIAGLHL